MLSEIGQNAGLLALLLESLECALEAFVVVNDHFGHAGEFTPLAPRSADAHLSLANFLWADKKTDDAYNELKTALDLEPRNAVANRAMALFYLQTNKPAAALKTGALNIWISAALR